MSLATGTRLGPYEIVSPLGAGGMGEVYTARDTRLDRTVAIKVLPPDAVGDAERHARFEREARAVAALQHPGICTIYDVGTTDGAWFLVMELLQGETLQQRLARRPLTEPEVIEIGTALTGALEAAHAAGIVHRDVKPANIFLTEHGAKLLDFGLAKAVTRQTAAIASMESTIDEAGITGRGTTVGTVAYMSPEQLRGEAIDARSDLFSLGLVLYEMATGRRAFAGATSAMISAAILHEQPRPPRQIRPELSPGLDDIILKAIEKDRALRYQHASDIRADLLRTARDTGSVAIAPGSRTPARTTRRYVVLAAAVAALAVVSAGAYKYLSRSPKLTDKDTIVLGDFSNTTRDAVFDETLRQGLAVQFDQSPFLSLVPDDRVRAALRLMGQPAAAKVIGDVAHDVCARTGAAAFVTGSIASLGSQYVLGLRAEHCGTGELLDQEQLQAARKEDVLNVLSQLATRFRTKIGESLATVQQHSTPLAEATTSSLEALKAYSMAMAIVANQPAAIPLLKRAVEIDPNFAMAYARLALFYSGQGESALGEENIRKAYELRDHAADRELFYISTIYDRQVTGNLEKEIATLRLWAQTYPRDQQAHGLQGGYYAAGTGQWELMVEKSKEAVDIGPDPAAAYGSVVLGEIAVGRLKEAEEFLHLALGRSPDAPNIMMLEYALAFLKGDDAAMEHVAAGAKGKPGAEDLISHVQSLALARAGRLERAREAARHSIELESPGQSERIAVWETGQAIWEALYGNAADAKRHALPALENVKTRHVAYAAALALALAGDGVVAQNVADDLEKRFPEDTSVRFAYVPTLRALAALNANDPARAIELLRAASRYEFAQPGIAFYGTGGGGVGAMYATYLRGQAYLALHRGSDAAAEFQKILDHPGVVLEDPIGGFARLQLARALTMAGDAGKAKAAYEDLMALWKEADPDLARPKQAKAEFAALR